MENEALFKWIGTVLVPILIAMLSSNWIGEVVKRYIDKKKGRVTSKDVLDAVSKVQSDMDTIKENMEVLQTSVSTLKLENDEDRAVISRVRILRFNDELIRQQKHSKESFDQTLEDIDTYEEYCRTHPEFKNNKTVMSATNIKECYRERLRKGDFLGKAGVRLTNDTNENYNTNN